MTSLALDLPVPAPAARRPRVLWLRIGILLNVVIALVLVLISYLNYSNYRKAYLEQNLTRYLIVAKDVRQTVLGGLNVGLEPAQNTRLLPAIYEEVRNGSGIRFIGVMDETGLVTGAGDVGPRAGRWRDSLAATAPDTYWQTSDADTIEVGLPFMNNFHIKSGAVVIGYDKRAIENAAGDMLRKLTADVLLTMVFVALLSFAGVWLATRRLAGALASVAATLDPQAPGSARLAVDGDLLGAGAAQEINDFADLSRDLVRDIASLEREVAAAQTKEDA